MACKSCGSEKQQYLSGELSVAFPAVEKLKQAPVYVVQKILVCLNCGYTELIIPTTELAQLRKGT
jgi:predicted nucleic-acid-binding Zn-ribbon protein